MRKLIALLCVLFLAAFVLSNVLTTTMTWIVATNKSHSISYGGNCSSIAFFFPEADANVDNDTDGNANKIIPSGIRAGGSACQSNTLAAVTITNNGNATENIDANFSAALDTNVWLKVWMGYGSPQGCGTGGFGGWSRLCSVTGTTNAVTQTTCKDFNSGNATAPSRLVTNLLAGDTNQLCFSGELMAEVATQPASVAGGDHNGTFQTNPLLS